MTTTKASKRSPLDVKSKQKRKNAEDSVEKEAPQSKPSKKARKDDTESLESSPKVTSKPLTDVTTGNDEDKGQESEDYHLTGFSSEEDSSDEEVDQTAKPLDVSKLPSLAKEDVALKKRLDDARKNQSEERGVVYLGRIPHGFYEDQMRAYFSQFGDVTRLRLSRNKKTGHSKHYAFIEFSSAEVAQIVSETMNNYLLMGHILQCRVIPRDQVHPELWVGANRKWRHVPHDRIVRVKHNKIRSSDEQARAEKALLARQRKKQKRIQESGIDYDIEPVAYSTTLKATQTA